MRHITNNLLVQFSVLSFVIMIALAAIMSLILTRGPDNTIDFLREHGAAMMAGSMIKATDPYSIPSLSEDTNTLRWMTFSAVGFAVLYLGLVIIVWRGWRTITRQQASIHRSNTELELKVTQERDYNARLSASLSERERLEKELFQSQKMEPVG